MQQSSGSPCPVQGLFRGKEVMTICVMVLQLECDWFGLSFQLPRPLQPGGKLKQLKLSAVVSVGLQ